VAGREFARPPQDPEGLGRFAPYLCRPAGKPATYDTRYPGTYNARRDSLEGYWRAQFGHTHGLLLAHRFFEHVEGPDGQNRILEFMPRDGSIMLIASLWSRWTDPTGRAPDLLSFAAITDEPEPEVAAAGHDRTVINLRPEQLEAWLNPDPSDLDALYRIFDGKRHPFYEHRVSA
jgi:putative SOS response-associated peptidase YedK